MRGGGDGVGRGTGDEGFVILWLCVGMFLGGLID